MVKDRTCVTKATEAPVVIDQLHTVEGTGGVAGSRQAFVDIPLTVFSNEARGAGTGVTAHAVYTLTPVQAARLRRAGPGGAVILVDLTLHTCGAAGGQASEKASASGTTYRDFI